MKLQEEILSIKNKMGLTESDASDFIEKYEKDLKLAKKLIPELIKLLKDNFGDDLYKIDYKIKGVAFGSTWIKDEKTGNSQSYSSEKVVFTLEFINKNYREKREIRDKFSNIIESFTPFNLQLYGCPIDVDFFNYTKEEF
jgi:hypothetical protein